MTHRASRRAGLVPVTLFVALACGSSHEPDAGGPSDGAASSGSSGVSVAGGATKPDPPMVGTGGATSPSPTAGVGNVPVGAGGFVGTGGSVAAGGFATGGAFGGAYTAGTASGGAAASGGVGGVQYPPGSCPALPPPNGSSCKSYVVDPGFECFYDAPACRVVSTCQAGAKWRSGCVAPGGDAGAPSAEGGAAGAPN